MFYQNTADTGRKTRRDFSVAFPQSFRNTPGPMRHRHRAVVGFVLFAVAGMHGSVAAQAPSDLDAGRQRLRDRYNKPQAAAKLDDAIRKFKSEDDVGTRLEGIEELGRVENDKKALDYILQAVNDPDPRVRVKAIDTLGDMQAKDATPLLVQQLFLRDTDLPTKRRILAALGKIGDPRAVGPISDFLSRNLDPSVRGNAIFALGDIGDRTALAPLEKLAQGGDPTLRPLAQEAIRKIKERPAPAVVPPALAVERRSGPPAQTP